MRKRETDAEMADEREFNGLVGKRGIADSPIAPHWTRRCFWETLTGFLKKENEGLQANGKYGK
jgi:hypothetical protein